MMAPKITGKKRDTTRRSTVKSAIESVEAKALSRRSWTEKLEDRIVATFGTLRFLVFNIVLFVVWALINSDFFPAIEPFDPYPYVLLITIVSLEAIVLAVFVLITQRRQARVDSIREETELQLSFIMEQELTKVLKILSVLLKKTGIDPKKDPELKGLMEPLDIDDLEEQLEEQIEEAT
jgi:uncharacterized membrane protein